MRMWRLVPLLILALAFVSVPGAGSEAGVDTCSGANPCAPN